MSTKRERLTAKLEDAKLELSDMECADLEDQLEAALKVADLEDALTELQDK